MKACVLHVALAIASVVIATPALGQQCPPTTPVQGAVPPSPLPLFPADNWWNLDISPAPVDPARRRSSPSSTTAARGACIPTSAAKRRRAACDIYGMPLRRSSTARSRSSRSRSSTGTRATASTTSTGAGHSVLSDSRRGDHAAALDRRRRARQRRPAQSSRSPPADRRLHEPAPLRALQRLLQRGQAKWYAGSGAFFDMNANDRRPDDVDLRRRRGARDLSGPRPLRRGVESGLADIGHAFRVTVRATNGYVFPASHRAGSTRRRAADGRAAAAEGQRQRPRPGAAHQRSERAQDLPRDAEVRPDRRRQRLATCTSAARSIRAGTTTSSIRRFAALTASDFDVIQLGWKPAGGGVAVASLSANPGIVTGGNASTGTVTLTSAAPAGGASVSLAGASTAVSVPATVTVAQGMTSANFGISTSPVTMSTSTTISASHGGVSKTTTFIVTPSIAPALAGITLGSASVVGGGSTSGNVTLTAPAGSGGTRVTLQSSRPSLVGVPSSVVVAAGTTSATFPVTTGATKRNVTAAVYATWAGVTRASGAATRTARFHSLIRPAVNTDFGARPQERLRKRRTSAKLNHREPPIWPPTQPF